MKNRNKYHAQSQKQAYLFLAPSMLILTVFVFIPLVGALVISVMNIDIYMNNISFWLLKCCRFPVPYKAWLYPLPAHF